MNDYKSSDPHLAGSSPTDESKDANLRRLLVLLGLPIGLTLGIYVIRQYLRQPLPSLSPSEQEMMVSTIEFTGKVSPAMNFKVSSLSGAIVRDVRVQVGDRVSAGQPLLILENLEAKQQYEQAQQQQETAQQQISQLYAQIDQLKQTASLSDQMNAVDGRYSVAQLQSQQIPLPQRQDSVQRARATYDLAFAQFNRMRMLAKEGATSQVEFDRATADLQVAEADLASAQKAAAISQRLEQEQQERITAQQKVSSAQQRQQITQLQGQLQSAQLQSVQASRKLDQFWQQGIVSNRNGILDFQTVIRATQEGVVVGVPVSAGDQIYAGTALMAMSQIDRLIVEVPVSHRLVNSLWVGQRAIVQIGAGSNLLNFDAAVVSVNPLPSDDLNHLVKVQFENSSNMLLVGQPAKVHFATK